MTCDHPKKTSKTCSKIVPNFTSFASKIRPFAPLSDARAASPWVPRSPTVWESWTVGVGRGPERCYAKEWTEKRLRHEWLLGRVDMRPHHNDHISQESAAQEAERGRRHHHHPSQQQRRRRRRRRRRVWVSRAAAREGGSAQRLRIVGGMEPHAATRCFHRSVPPGTSRRFPNRFHRIELYT